MDSASGDIIHSGYKNELPLQNGHKPVQKELSKISVGDIVTISTVEESYYGIVAKKTKNWVTIQETQNLVRIKISDILNVVPSPTFVTPNGEIWKRDQVS